MPYKPAVGACHSIVSVRQDPQACAQSNMLQQSCHAPTGSPKRAALAGVQVPDGLLVFFPSYSVMKDCIEAWQMPSTSNNTWSGTIWDRILRQKLAVIEPQVLCNPPALTADLDPAARSLEYHTG